MVFGMVWDNVENPLPFARNLISICFLLAALLCIVALKETKGNNLQ